MKNKNYSNRGGALLSVIIVMTIVGILGALAISVAYTNYMMKVVDKKSTDNFYSAEKVLEEIVTGLEVEASSKYKEAYTAIMEQYDSYDTIIEMEEDFSTEFVVGMVDAIQVTGNNKLYEIGVPASEGVTATGLYQYVKDNYGTATYTIQSVDNEIETLTDGLCLRNVNVTYQDGNYYNTITTDIKITIPEVQFALIAAMPEIGEYSYIAEGGTDITGNSGIILAGKAYNGVNEEGTSITLNEGASFDATSDESVLLISKGDILLKGPSADSNGNLVPARFSTGDKTALWTTSITVGTSDENKSLAANVVTLSGRSYVKDDTTLNGTQNQLILSGQYFGYSNNDLDASQSSAIIVNGQDSEIDMSSLDTLVIAGTAYVSTASSSLTVSDSLTETTGVNVVMGDSIAIKSNQLAYLLPTECKGIVSNPMSYAQYKALASNWEEEAKGTYLSMIRGTLNDYGDLDIVPVFSAQGGGVVYLYLNFANSARASEYFMDYYDVNEARVENFIDRYLDVITFNTTESGMTRLETHGNYLVEAEDNTVEYVKGSDYVSFDEQEFTNYKSSFEALCKKLITNKSSLTDEEKADSATVFNNLVNRDEVEAFVDAIIAASTAADATMTNVEVSSSKREVVMNAGEDIEAIIVDNADGTAYSVDKNLHKAGIILATGDVTISGSGTQDWEGLIICGGELTVTGSKCGLQHNADYIGKAMRLSCDVTTGTGDTAVQKTYMVLNLFESGASHVSGSTSSTADLTDIRNCITYENYKSE